MLFAGDGYVILKMIVEIIPMKVKKCAEGHTGHVLNPNSNVAIPNAFQINGDVIMMTIVAMVLMKSTVETLNAKYVPCYYYFSYTRVDKTKIGITI